MKAQKWPQILLLTFSFCGVHFVQSQARQYPPISSFEDNLADELTSSREADRHPRIKIRAPQSTPITSDDLIERIRTAFSSPCGNQRLLPNRRIHVQKSTIEMLGEDARHFDLKNYEHDEEEAEFAIIVIKLEGPSKVLRMGGTRSNNRVNVGPTLSSFVEEAGQVFNRSVCFLPPPEGACRGYIPFWYFDQSTQKCEEFGCCGCHGNGNRFETKDDCTRVCGRNQNLAPTITTTTKLREPEIPPTLSTSVKAGQVVNRSVCLLPLVQGPCRADIRSWYFDNSTQKCEEFGYGGCFGNENRFDTKDGCTRVCGGNQNLAPTTTTKLPERGPETTMTPDPDCNRYQRMCRRMRCQFGVTVKTQIEENGCPLCTCQIDPCSDQVCEPGYKCESSLSPNRTYPFTGFENWVSHCVPAAYNNETVPAMATIYYMPNLQLPPDHYNSRTETCKYLTFYDYLAVSIDTHGSCVKLYKDGSCEGTSLIFQPQNGKSVFNLGPRYSFLSVGPCAS